MAQVEECSRVFEEFGAAGLKQDVSSVNAVVEACCVAKKVRGAGVQRVQLQLHPPIRGTPHLSACLQTRLLLLPCSSPCSQRQASYDVLAHMHTRMRSLIAACECTCV